MRLLEALQILQDEGLGGTTKLMWNVLTQQEIRDCILLMRQVFYQHCENLGYIALCGVRES